MYGSYGSYSSMSSMSSPIDISRSNLSAHDAACAFPSWPRRASLADSEEREERATSYLSDDDLFLSDPFDDDVRSISSSSTSSSPAAMPSPPRLSDMEILEMQRQKLALQRECMRQLALEKERRKQAAKNKKRSGSSKKSSSSSKVKLPTNMTPISEDGE